MHIVNIVLGWIAIAAVIALITAELDRSKRAQDQQFADREFQTSAGPLRGRELHVVRRLVQGFDARSQTHWWYCVAPGRRWLLIIAQHDAMSRKNTKWVVRELTEDAMRAALAGDAQALAAAFPPTRAETGGASG
jgi:hypothetical protein